MAQRRLKLRQDILAPEQAGVIAQPVNTYTTPVLEQVARPNGLNVAQDFRNVLSGLNGLIDRNLEADLTRQRDSLQERGKLLAFQNQVDYKQAVEQGILLKEENPYVKLGYQTQQAKVAVADFNNQIKQLYATGGFNNEDDPTRLKEEIQNRTEAFQEQFKGYYPEAVKGIAGDLQATQAEILKLHATDRQKANYFGLENAYQQNVINSLSGFNPKDPTSLSKVSTQIQAYTNNASQLGLKTEDLVSGGIDAVLNKATQNRDPSLIDKIGKTKVNFGFGEVELDSTPYWQEKAFQKRSQIVDQVYQERNNAFNEKNRQRVESDRAVDVKVSEALLNGGNVKATLKAFAKTNPVKVAQWELKLESIGNRETSQQAKQEVLSTQIQYQETGVINENVTTPEARKLVGSLKQKQDDEAHARAVKVVKASAPIITSTALKANGVSSYDVNKKELDQTATAAFNEFIATARKAGSPMNKDIAQSYVAEAVRKKKVVLKAQQLLRSKQGKR
jgi:hypothetical protein